jgi:hypothetical protein
MKVKRLTLYLPTGIRVWRAETDCEECGVELDQSPALCYYVERGTTHVFVGLPFSYVVEKTQDAH